MSDLVQQTERNVRESIGQLRDLTRDRAAADLSEEDLLAIDKATGSYIGARMAHAIAKGLEQFLANPMGNSTPKENGQ